MKMFIKEFVRMAKNEDVNEFLCSVIPGGEDENCIEILPYIPEGVNGTKSSIDLIKADGDMEEVLSAIGIALVHCADTSISIYDGYNVGIVPGKAIKSRFYEDETELILDFNKIILQENILWELCPHCSYEVPLKKSFRIQHCPNCGEKILPCSLCDMDKENCSECPLKKGKKKAITK